MSEPSPDLIRKLPENPKKHKMNPDQRRMAASRRQIEETLAARAATAEINIMTKEERVEILKTARDKIRKGARIDSLNDKEKGALVESIGLTVGQRLSRAVKTAGEKTADAIPFTIPTTLIVGESFRQLAEKYPKFLSIFTASNQAAVILLGLGYLAVIGYKGRRNGEKFSAPVVAELKKHYNAALENSARAGAKATMFTSALIGAILAFEDPVGKGTTIAPIFGGVATLGLMHEISDQLTNQIAKETVKRLSDGQTVDINNPSFLISMGVTEVKRFAKAAVRKIRKLPKDHHLLEELGEQKPTKIIHEGVIERFFDTILEEEELSPDNGGGTPPKESTPERGSADRRDGFTCPLQGPVRPGKAGPGIKNMR